LSSSHTRIGTQILHTHVQSYSVAAEIGAKTKAVPKTNLHWGKRSPKNIENDFLP